MTDYTNGMRRAAHIADAATTPEHAAKQIRREALSIDAQENSTYPRKLDKEVLMNALREIIRRIECCGASEQLTHAVTLASDLLLAVDDVPYASRAREALQRVCNALDVAGVPTAEPLPCPWCAEKPHSFGHDEGWDVQCMNGRCPVEPKAIAFSEHAAITPETGALRAIIERDRTLFADVVTNMRKTLSGVDWMASGRGSYEWDDARYQKEFGEAVLGIRAQLDVLAQRARDWSNSPVKWSDIQAARSFQYSRESNVHWLAKQLRDRASGENSELLYAAANVIDQQADECRKWRESNLERQTRLEASSRTPEQPQWTLTQELAQALRTCLIELNHNEDRLNLKSRQLANAALARYDAETSRGSEGEVTADDAEFLVQAVARQALAAGEDLGYRLTQGRMLNALREWKAREISKGA